MALISGRIFKLGGGFGVFSFLESFREEVLASKHNFTMSRDNSSSSQRRLSNTSHCSFSIMREVETLHGIATINIVGRDPRMLRFLTDTVLRDGKFISLFYFYMTFLSIVLNRLPSPDTLVNLLT